MSLQSKPRGFITLTMKITSWYSLFLILLLSLIIASATIVTRQMITHREHTLLDDGLRRIAASLIDSTSQQTTETTLVPIENGIYFSLYTIEGTLIKGVTPTTFDASLGMVRDQYQTYQGEKKMYLYKDIFIKERNQWLRGVIAISPISENLLLLPYALFIISPIFLTIVLVGGYFITKRALKPLKEITNTASSIAKEGNFSKRLSVPPTKDELSQMGLAFNQMLETLEASYLREKQFSSDVSHELRTPLAIIYSESQYGYMYSNDKEDKDSFEVILKQAQQMTALVDQILEMTRLNKQTQLVTKNTNLSLLLEESMRNYETLATEKMIAFSYQLPKDIYAFVNPQLLQRVFDNLFSNALKFTKDKIHIQLDSTREYITISFSNNGPMIAPNDRVLIWERFYQIDSARNKSHHASSGLGLSFVKMIIDLHLGEIFLVSTPEETTFRIQIPRKIQ